MCLWIHFAPKNVRETIFFNRKDSIQGKKKKKIPVIADSVLLPFKKTDIYKPYLC